MTAAPLIDCQLPDTLDLAVACARSAESAGFAGVWASEARTDPLQILAPVAMAAENVRIGTNLVVALARNPLIVAEAAWTLQAASAGRFVLGLGTQVRAHLQNRFGVEWRHPRARLREYVGALRHLWSAFQQEREPDFTGRFFRHTRLGGPFAPPPIKWPRIPIYLGGVTAGTAQLAGEIADGFLVHPFHTRAHLETCVLPALEKGAAHSGRTLQDIVVVVPPMVANAGDEREREQVTRRVAFFASTPAYADVLRVHGLEELGPAVRRLVAGDLAAAAALVPPSFVDEVAVFSRGSGVAQVQARYAQIAHRIILPSSSVGAPGYGGADEG